MDRNTGPGRSPSWPPDADETFTIPMGDDVDRRHVHPAQRNRRALPRYLTRGNPGLGTEAGPDRRNSMEASGDGRAATRGTSLGHRAHPPGRRA